MGKFVDISGMKFGRLTVIDRAPNRDKTTMWNCECECSNKTVVPGGDLKNGTTKSCGCLQIDVVKKRNYKHGFSYGQQIIKFQTNHPPKETKCPKCGHEL